MIPLDAIAEHAEAQPDAIALEHGAEKVTWSRYYDQVARVSAWLAEHVTSVDATAVVEAPASSEAFVVISALATARIPWVALDPQGDRTVRDHQRSLLSPALVVAEDAEGRVVLRTASSGEDTMLADAISEDRPGRRPLMPERRFRALGFTSGTTGLPKCVVRSRSSEGPRNALFIKRFGFGTRDRFLLCLPLSHASGHGWARTFLTCGGTVVIGSSEPKEIAANLAGSAITASLIVPPVLDAVVNVLRDRFPNERVCGQVRFLLTGGRHLSPGLVGRVTRTIGPVLHAYYGTTETGVNAFAEPIDLLIDPRCSGTVVDGSAIAIVDAEGNEVSSEAPGRVAIASYMNADSYDDGDIPSVELGGIRYTLTADLGVMSGDGVLTILGRASEEVSASECGDLIGFENDLRLLAGVTDAAVAVDSKRFAVAAIEMAEATIDEPLMEYLAIRLGKQRGVQLPIKARIVPTLQFNRTGKFDLTKSLVRS